MVVLSGCVSKEHKEKIENDEPVFIEDKEDELVEIYNYVDGYTFKTSNDYTIDRSMENVRTRLYNDQTIIDIYYDNFEGTIDNKETYMSYSNKFIENEKYHKVLQNERKKIHGNDVHLLKWTRDKLKHVDNDKNYYFSAEIAKNEFEVYTVMIKSTEEIKNEEEILNSFKFVDKKAEAKEVAFQVEESNWNDETKTYYQNTFINSDKMQWGLFDASHLNDLTRTKALEEELQYKFPVLLRYQMIGESEFPKEEMESAYLDGRTVELTLQYAGTEEVILYEILDGKYDDYLNNYAKQVHEFGHPILFRLNNEMNGDWVTYSAYHASKDTDMYIEVWKYVHEIFEKNKVDNAIWVWNPNHHSKPNYKWNHPLMYYPGSEYIDVVGLTAYNTGTYHEGETWRSFKDLYDEIYYQYADWFEHPLMITEFASSSIGGDKVKWINDMFNEMDKYERLRLAIWWSWQDFDAEGNPARLYFLDENENTTNAFKEGLRDY